LQGTATGDKNNKNRGALEKKHVCKFADGAYELYDFESDLTVVEKPMLAESPSTEALIQTRREDKFFAGRAFGCSCRAFRAPNDGIFSGPIADDDGYGGYHGKYYRMLDDKVGDDEGEDGDGEGRRRTKTMRRTKKGMSKERSGWCHPRELFLL